MMIEHAHAASLIPHLAMMCSQHPHCLKVPRVTHPVRPAWAQFCFNGDHSRIEMRQEVDTLPWEPNSTISDVLKPLGAGFSGATTSLAPAVRALAAGTVAHSVEGSLCYDALFLNNAKIVCGLVVSASMLCRYPLVYRLDDGRNRFFLEGSDAQHLESIMRSRELD